MTAHVPTKAELQAWVDMLSDEEVRKAMQAKLDAETLILRPLAALESDRQRGGAHPLRPPWAQTDPPLRASKLQGCKGFRLPARPIRRCRLVWRQPSWG